MAMARPGEMEIHGAYCIYSLPSLIITPQSGDGGCAPSPRKLRDAQYKIIVPISREASISILDITFGNTYLTII